jgi:Beta-ketoacyl synthase, N-terminal domain
MIRTFVDGIGLLGPGLAGWEAAEPVLGGRARYAPADMPRPTTDLLPPAERRRCGETARLALSVGMAALRSSATMPENLATVFTSSSGNGEVVHQICESLAAPEREVSPTRFHNSVHNAPAGYWSIATGARPPSTSLCAYHGSFAAGLLEAALQAHCERRRVLLIAYELPHPFPLSAVSPVTAPFGAAMLVAPTATATSLGALTLEVIAAQEESPMPDVALERLRAGNSAARALPVLAAIARRGRSRVSVPYLPEHSVVVEVAA